MAGFRVIASTEGLSKAAIRSKARAIKRMLERHPGLTRRTGDLSSSAYVQVYFDLNLIVAGARAPYASFLAQGQGNLKRSYPYIRNAMIRYIGANSILQEGEI